MVTHTWSTRFCSNFKEDISISDFEGAHAIVQEGLELIIGGSFYMADPSSFACTCRLYGQNICKLFLYCVGKKGVYAKCHFGTWCWYMYEWTKACHEFVLDCLIGWGKCLILIPYKHCMVYCLGVIHVHFWWLGMTGLGFAKTLDFWRWFHCHIERQLIFF